MKTYKTLAIAIDPVKLNGPLDYDVTFPTSYTGDITIRKPVLRAIIMQDFSGLTDATDEELALVEIYCTALTNCFLGDIPARGRWNNHEANYLSGVVHHYATTLTHVTVLNYIQLVFGVIKYILHSWDVVRGIWPDVRDTIDNLSKLVTPTDEEQLNQLLCLGVKMPLPHWKETLARDLYATIEWRDDELTVDQVREEVVDRLEIMSLTSADVNEIATMTIINIAKVRVDDVGGWLYGEHRNSELVKLWCISIYQEVLGLTICNTDNEIVIDALRDVQRCIKYTAVEVKYTIKKLIRRHQERGGQFNDEMLNVLIDIDIEAGELYPSLRDYNNALEMFPLKSFTYERLCTLILKRDSDVYLKALPLELRTQARTKANILLHANIPKKHADVIKLECMIQALEAHITGSNKIIEEIKRQTVHRKELDVSRSILQLSILGINIDVAAPILENTPELAESVYQLIQRVNSINRQLDQIRAAERQEGITANIYRQVMREIRTLSFEAYPDIKICQ